MSFKKGSPKMPMKKSSNPKAHPNKPKVATAMRQAGITAPPMSASKKGAINLDLSKLKRQN